MTDDPFLTLVIEALNLMHPRFAAAWGSAYPAGETGPDKWRERPFLLEFYHALRTLWDRGVPVGLGLGHLVLQDEPETTGERPDLLLWQLGERGGPSRRLAAVSLAFAPNAAQEAERLKRFGALGYPYAVSVVIGRAAEGMMGDVFFDIERWNARVVNPD